MVRVDVSVEGAVATVVFEKPGVLNALAPDDLPPLGAALRDAGSRDGVNVLVVRGAGGAFSAGDDLKATADLTQDEWRTVVEGFHELTRIALALEVPVIAAIDGVCIGGAFEFACSCDLRVATTRSRFACPEVGIGLVISNASTVLLPRLCGAGYASELMLTGRLIGAKRGVRQRPAERGRRACPPGGQCACARGGDRLARAARRAGDEAAARRGARRGGREGDGTRDRGARPAGVHHGHARGLRRVPREAVSVLLGGIGPG